MAVSSVSKVSASEVEECVDSAPNEWGLNMPLVTEGVVDDPGLLDDHSSLLNAGTCARWYGVRIASTSGDDSSPHLSTDRMLDGRFPRPTPLSVVFMHTTMLISGLKRCSALMR
ncbi:methyl- -binding domain 5-like protein, putative [Babesia ovata]|uniref:Methyl--binding domain 5-like protein, putative n=1 Tax=Babesia ovata TaxID=189622 RepID=A0A2H6KGL3_9APIC|nr:methyl- -binding domain 5-like protein, putative [Babesia ovata]GBE62109.1 methyl- -binding domain 5-like protein, putative [Babesia ovata]